MNLRDIKELMKIMDASNLSEFHIEQEDIKLTIKKELAKNQVNTMDRSDYLAREVRIDNVSVSPLTIVEKKDDENLHIIKSPIVGIYYSFPGPELPAYVKVGDIVKSGQVLCIVEAMKLMNEITSDIDGEVAEILGVNQEPVEFGQPLFKIRKV
jgi:acetyl-CoA carboxylase biotin carboxyl carrier protein